MTFGRKTSRLRTRAFLTALFKGLWIYSLLIWVWVGINYYVFPQFQTGPITLYVWVPQNLVATIAFPVSFVSFVAWEYLRKAPGAE